MRRTFLILLVAFCAGAALNVFADPHAASGQAVSSAVASSGPVSFSHPQSWIEKYHVPAVTPKLWALSYRVFDIASGAVLFEKNPDAVFPIASVTKLMTAATSFPDASSTPDLAYPMLLESSNAAADQLGNVDAMNAKASELGMSATRYADASGLSPENVSSVEDLTKLLAYLVRARPDILAITRLTRHKQWINHNQFVRDRDPRYEGGKTGYTPEAKQTFVARFHIARINRDVGVVLLQSPNRVRDTRMILRYLEQEVDFSRAPSRQVSLLAVGDIMLGRGVTTTTPFAGSGFLKDASIAFANLEGPLSDKGYDLGGPYSFRMAPERMSDLSSAGFAALSVANNHAGDWGRGAFDDTITRLEEAGIAPVGGGHDGADARTVRIIERNGLRIGFLGFSDVGPSWLEGPPNVPSMLLASDPDFASLIHAAAARVDHLVVSIHFGEEYQTAPTARQVALAHAAIDAGADVVLGHHPHVIQPVERYKNGVIAYSLGNFVFDQSFSPATMEGLALEVLFDGAAISDVNTAHVRMNASYQPSLAGSGEEE